MSRIKLTASLIIFAILLSFTSIIKNKTRLIEKKIFKLNKEISYKKKDLNETQLDFFYLSSPLQLSNKIRGLPCWSFYFEIKIVDVLAKVAIFK